MTMTSTGADCSDKDEHTDDTEEGYDETASPSDKDIIAAQLLERYPEEYVPGTAMFTAACRAWGQLIVENRWFISRDRSVYLLPKFHASNDLHRVGGDIQELDLKIERLQKMVRGLDDEDMGAFFRNIVFDTQEHFQNMFTPEFCGGDKRLQFIQAFITSHGGKRKRRKGGDAPSFFEGEKDADRTVRFVHGMAMRMAT